MPAESSPSPSSQQLGAALANLEETLQEVLTARARAAIEDTLSELGTAGHAVRIADVQFDVTIQNITMSSAHDAARREKPSLSPPSARPAKPGARKRRAARGQRGAIRGALLEVFESPGETLSTEDLRTRLESVGLTPSSDNLHQHLGRLVKDGNLQRPGRGLYQLSRPAATTS